MAKMIKIRHVPDELRQRLLRRRKNTAAASRVGVRMFEPRLLTRDRRLATARAHRARIELV